MSLKKLLEKAGVSRYQQTIFIFLLTNPHTTAKQISKETKVPNGRIYSELETLEEQRYVESDTSRPKKYSIPNPRNILLELIEKEKEKIEVIEKDAFDQLGKSNQLAEIFQTKPEIKQSQIEVFRFAKKEVCQCLGIIHKPSENKDLKPVYEKEIIAAVRRGVIFNSLYQKNQKPPSTLLQLHKQFPKQVQIRYSEFPIPRFDIVDSGEILLKVQDPMNTTTTVGTLIISNQHFAKNLRSKFLRLWESSSLK